VRPRNDNNVFNDETIIRAFVEHHWTTEEIREHTNQSGHWLQVPSPDKNQDERRCLGFDLSSGRVIDWYSGFRGDFVQYVVRHLDLRNRKEAERSLTDLIFETGLDAAEILKKPAPKPEPMAGMQLLPEMALPPSCVPIHLDQPPPYPWMGPLVHAHQYLHSRGITADEARAYQLHFCIEGWYSDRLVIPVWDEHSRLVWFQARDLLGTRKNKYLNPPNVDKSGLIYGLNQVQPGDRVVLVEGIFDGWKCNWVDADGARTLGNVVFGKNVTELHLVKIMNRQPREIVVGSDADPAGLETIFSMIRRYGDIPFKIAILPVGAKDFGAMDRQAVAAVINQAEPWSFMTKMLLIARGVPDEVKKK